MSANLLHPVLTLARWTWSASVQAGVLVCLILAVRALLRRHLAPGWVYNLWLLVLLRLALPWQPESTLSIYNLWPARRSVAAAPAMPTPPRLPASRPAPPRNVSLLEAPTPEPHPGATWLAPARPELIAGGWLAGVLLVLGSMVWQSISFSSRLNRTQAAADPRLLELLESCKENMGVRGRLRVIESTAVASPALVGLVRPSLILPRGMAERLPPQRLRFVLLHELAHLRRHDIAVACLMGVLLALHWFNPLVWLTVRRMRADRELASDALALTHAGPGVSSEYGHTIIELMTAKPLTWRLATVAGILEHRTEMKRRIEMIMNFHSTSRVRSLAALAIFLGLALTTLTTARSDNAPAPAPTATPMPMATPAPPDFKVKTTTDARGRYVDTIDFPFVSDPQAIGHWESVDFVRKMADFTPGKKPFKQGDLFLKSLDLRPNGTTNWAFTWTRGLILHDGEKTASHYVIKPLAGTQYMFFEWKSGDYTIRHQAPCYYVLKKTSATPTKAPERIVDKIDYPFVDDPRLVGHWQSVDFVREIKDFSVDHKQFGGDLYLKEMTFLPGGKTPQPWWIWTKGLVMHRGDKTAAAYEIREIGGQSYLFMEWKSGDYTLRHMKPEYYVLKKDSGASQGQP